MGCPVDKDLMKLISVELSNLEKDVDNIRQSSTNDATKLSAALQTIRDEIDNFDERITEIERNLEAERKERLEKEEALSDAMADISSDLVEVDQRVGVNERDISQLKDKQSNLETTVSSVSADIGDLKKGQTRLDARVEALEKGNFKTADVQIFQVPKRNNCFCGRQKELKAIAAHLKNTQNGCIDSAICGLGGVGKTSLAVEFLWQNDKEYPGGIFWISGEKKFFQRSVNKMARQIGTIENDFHNSLSGTLDWLRKRKKLWCLVVDNLDELEMSEEMRELLTGSWKYKARGHIIITTRREISEIEEATGIDEQCCIDLKCLTEEEGIQFLQRRTGRTDKGEDNDLRQLVRELGGLPLALDQAGAFIRSVKQSIKEYVKKYKKQRVRLLEKTKARHLVENTSKERLAVHTTWMLNFDHISRMSEEMDLGEVPTLFMQVSTFYCPDDIPYELINEGLQDEGSSEEDNGMSDEAAEIVSLLTKFSLFQRYGTDSFSVHRLVQEVIQSELQEEQTRFNVLSRAVRALHHALKNTRSPAEVCESFVEDAVFSVENPPSLQLWAKLASHATYLQEHLSNFSVNHGAAADTLLYTEETIRVFNEAGIFFSVSQEKVKAQEVQKLKLEFLVNPLTNSTEDYSAKLPNYFIDIPLKDRDCKLISHCMRQPATDSDLEDEADSVKKEREEKVDQLREQGNVAVKNKKYEEAVNLYSSAIDLTSHDHRLFANRALCYMKLTQPQQALDDCEKCLLLCPRYSKALQRKAWALQKLVENGSSHLEGQKMAALAVAIQNEPSLCSERGFWEKFPQVSPPFRVIENETQLTFVLMTAQGTLLLKEGVYNLKRFIVFKDFQIVGLGKEVVLRCTECCLISSAKCYFENIVFPKGNIGLVCKGKEAAIHMKHCQISGGSTSCEDYPECNGGEGCIAASLGKPVCDRTGKFGDSESKSGVGGFSGVQIVDGSFALIEDCAIHDCGGGGALVAGKGSRMAVIKCEVYKNHQAGLEAREGGTLSASQNKIFNSGFHGVLIGPNAGECLITTNKIFENAKEGIYACSNENKIEISKNDVHHNRPFGLSLDRNSHLVIRDNKIFENGFWGILAKSRTSAVIKGNLISGNKCGGIFIGVNYSARVHLESNTVRDHGGPWLEYQQGSFSLDTTLFEEYSSFLGLPPGEKQIYCKPPILVRNKEFNNEEGMYHPKEVIERCYTGCTFCRRSRSEVSRLIKCPNCHIASYCSRECREKHLATHNTLCSALRSRYAVTVKTFSHLNPGQAQIRTFGTHLKGIRKGPKPKCDGTEKFIVKIQTQNLNSHPLQTMGVYDKSLTLDCKIQSPEIFSVIMECGVLGKLHKFTSKKVFCWATFAEREETLTVFLDHLAPYQEW